MERELAVRDWHWEITKDCNLKCLHCILGGRGGQELTTQESLIALGGWYAAQWRYQQLQASLDAD